jgi:glycosyltransferase involved in cell wall biosynthesis
LGYEDQMSIKIAMVTASVSRQGAGVTTVVEAFSHHVAKLGHQVQVFGLRDAIWDNEGSELWAGSAVAAFSVLGPAALGYAPAMEKALIDWNPDVVHLHGVWMHPSRSVLRWSKRTRRPYVISAHGMLSELALSYSPKKKYLAKLLYQNATFKAAAALHATAASEQKEIYNYGIRQPVAVVPHGIDIPAHIPKHTSAEIRTLLYLGRIHPVKRLADLVLAWSHLENDNPNWRLRIVGPDEVGETDKLQRMIESAGLKRVSIEPPLYGTEKQLAYFQADLFVLPTGSENFAMTVAESLASAVPVICTKGAPWAGLEDHRCGWWTDIGAEPVEKALREAMALSPDALYGMGLRGRAWMERDFSWAQVAQQMEQTYLWLLGTGQKPASLMLD